MKRVQLRRVRGWHLLAGAKSVAYPTPYANLFRPRSRPGLQVQRTELVDTDHPPIGRRIVVQVKDAGHLRSELRIGAGLPGLGRLPADARRAQDLTDRFGTDPNVLVLCQVGDQFGQVPTRERLVELVRRSLGDSADLSPGSVRRMIHTGASRGPSMSATSRLESALVALNGRRNPRACQKLAGQGHVAAVCNTVGIAYVRGTTRADSQRRKDSEQLGLLLFQLRYERDVPWQDLAEATGRSISGLRRRLQRHGYITRPPSVDAYRKPKAHE